MEIRKRMHFAESEKERDVIFFTVKYNHYRDVSTSASLEMRDREEIRECECVLCLPENYDPQGEETPLILSFHGATGRVCAEDGRTGGVYLAEECLDHGYAVMDVCGSEKHGTTMGCPEHLFAAYKAYRYAVKHYNLSRQLLLAGSSMGGHTAMNFANMFPSIVVAAGIFCPRLNMDGVMVGDHYCIGTWDKTAPLKNLPSSRDLVRDLFHFPGGEWCEENTVGFNPYRTRSFVNAAGERVVIPPCPVKIWQGTADEAVDPVMTEEYYRSIRRSGSYAELCLLEGVRHEVVPVMQKELLLWFNRFC